MNECVMLRVNASLDLIDANLISSSFGFVYFRRKLVIYYSSFQSIDTTKRLRPLIQSESNVFTEQSSKRPDLKGHARAAYTGANGYLSHT